MRGNALSALDRLEEAVVSYECALAMQPQNVEALNNLGSVLHRMGRLQEALAAYERVLEFRPGDAETLFNTSFVRLAMGDYERGWAEYEWRWQAPGPLRPQYATHEGAPFWLGEEDVSGRTVLVHPEQGIGDSIQMARYVPLLAARGARVVLACYPLLMDLFRSVGGVAALIETGGAIPAFDFHVSTMSLPRAFRTALATLPAQVPYLRAPAPAAEVWRRRLVPHAGRPKVGLVWAGNPKHARDRARSIPIEKLAPLLAATRCAFFSLQKGPAAERATEQSAGALIDYTVELASFGETAALIEALDLVISVDTAVAHLAGALGKPVWILLPTAPDWRWMHGREDSPWYPTARLFRQPASGDWDSVLRRLARELAGWAPDEAR